MKGTKLIQIYLQISIHTATFVSITWHQKEPFGVVLYAHIAQLTTHTTNVYMTAVAYLAIMLLSLLAYGRG